MFKRKSVLYTWCISYGLLLLMMVALCVILGYHARTQLANEYKSITQTLQRQTNASIENYFNDLERAAYEISNDYLVTDFVVTPDPSGSKYYNLTPIQQLLSVHALQNGDTVRQYLYMGNIGRALSSDAIYRTHEFYEKLSLAGALTEAEFSELLRTHHYNQLFVFEIDGSAQPMMLTSVPLLNGTPKGTLVQVIPHEALRDMMRANNAVEDSTTVLLDTENTLLNWTGDEEVALLLPGADLSSIRDSEITLGTESYWIECQPLTKARWQLVTVVPMRSLVQKTHWIVRQSLPIMLIMVLFSGALCFLFLYIQYKPLHRLRKELTAGTDSAAAGNEYDQVLAAFTDARDGRNQIQALWEMHLDRLWDELARSCIQDDMVYDEARLREVMGHLGVGFAGEWFGVALLDSAQCTESGAAEEPDTLLAQALSAAVPPESGARVKLLQCSGQWLALINAAGEDDIAQALTRLQSGAQAHGLPCACSRPWKSFQNIHLAYLEAGQALHRQSGQPAGAQIFTAAAGAPLFSTEQEELLQRYMLAGNSEKAQEMLEQILRVNWEEQQLTVSLCRCLAYDLLCGMLRVLGTRPAVWDAQRDALRADLHRLRHQNTREELADTLRETTARLSQACACAGREIQRAHGQPMDRLMQCINEHYRDTDFNVSRAAEYLGMNVSYLSNLFKQQTGIGLLSYINGMRVQYAKQCILERHVSVAQAAHEAGFENINTFIRIFKKFEGVTPGSMQN